MISSRYSFLYLHVSKTGGNSIQSVLLPFSDDRQTCTAHQDGQDRFGVTGPLTPKKHARLQNYEDLAPGISTSLTIMISVRHPFERALSAYFSPHRWLARKADGSYRGQPPVWDEAAFFDFLASPEVLPMHEFLRLNGGLQKADIILRYESLATDFAEAVRRLKLPPTAVRSLPHVNRSAAGSIQRALLQDCCLRDAVEKLFRTDMEVFDYPSYESRK